MATLDDVVDALNRLNDTLEEVRDGLEGGGGGPGSAGGRSGAAARGQSGTTAAGGGGLGEAVGDFGKSMGKAFSGAKAISRVLDQTGVTAGLRESALGASTSEARGVGARSAIRQASSLPFAGFGLARTQNVLEAQDRAQQTVSGLAEQVARAGGEIDEDSIRSSLGRFNEIERNVQSARNRVRQIQGEVGREELAQAAGEDRKDIEKAVGATSAPLLAAIQELTAVMREGSSRMGGLR